MIKYNKIDEYTYITKFNKNIDIKQKLNKNSTFFHKFVKNLHKHFNELELEDGFQIDNIMNMIEIIEFKVNKEIITSNKEYQIKKKTYEKERNFQKQKEIKNLEINDISILANKNHMKTKIQKYNRY